MLSRWKLGLFDSFRFFQCFDKRIPQYYVDSKMYHTYLLNNYKIKFYNFIKYIVMVSCMYELLTYKHQTVSSFVDTVGHTRGGCLWGPNPHDPCKSKQSFCFHFFFVSLCDRENGYYFLVCVSYCFLICRSKRNTRMWTDIDRPCHRLTVLQKPFCEENRRIFHFLTVFKSAYFYRKNNNILRGSTNELQHCSCT